MKKLVMGITAAFLSFSMTVSALAFDVPLENDVQPEEMLLESQLMNLLDTEERVEEETVQPESHAVIQTARLMTEQDANRNNHIQNVDFACEADTFVHKGNSANYGSDKQMIVTTANAREAYFRFDLGEEPLQPESAVLRFYQDSTNRPPVDMKIGVADNDDWDENEINWGSRLSYIYATDFKTVENGKAWIEVDVTETVRNALEAGKRRVTFVIYDELTTGANYYFASRESGNGPALRMRVAYQPEPKRGEIICQDYILIPEGWESRIPLKVNAWDQFDASMGELPEEEVVFHVDGQPDGVWIDGSELVVDSTALPGNVFIKAEFGGISSEKKILVSTNELHSTSFPVLKDAMVCGGNTNRGKNYGGANLMVRGDGYRKFFMAFNFKRMQGAIKSARLRLYKEDDKSGVIKLALADTSDWTEGTGKEVAAKDGEICNDNAPAYGPELAAFELTSDKGYVEFDVTSALQQIANWEQESDKIATLVFFGNIPGAEDNFTMRSRETSTPPELTVDYYYQPVVSSVAIEGAKTIIIPDEQENDAEVEYEAVLCDHFGEPVEADTAWSVSGTEGVSVEKGKVTVSSSAVGTEGFDLTAAAGGMVHTAHISLIDSETAVCMAREMFQLEEMGLITEDIDLPSVFEIPGVGGGAVSISWTSSDESFLHSDGSINRPPADYPAYFAEVDVHASFQKGSVSTESVYTLQIAREGRRITISPELGGFYYRTQFTPWDYQMKNGMRWALYRFDIAEYIEKLNLDYVYSARLRLSGDAKVYIETHYVPDDTWGNDWEKRLADGVVPDFVAPEVDDLLDGGYYIIENDTKAVGVDVLNVLKRDLESGDTKLSLRTGSARSDLSNNLKIKDPVLEIEAIYDAKPTTLAVEQDVFYDPKIRIPSSGTEERIYIGKTLDQFGTTMEDCHTFSLKEAYPGVTVSADGVVAVDETAQPGTITLSVTSAIEPALAVSYKIELIEKIDVVRPQLYLTEDDIYEFRQRVIQNPKLMERIRSETTAAEGVAGQVSSLYEINGWRASTDTPWRTFVAPSGAAYAEFGIAARGIGKVMWDNLAIQNLGKEDLYMENGGFETGTGNVPSEWNMEVLSGSPVLKWENNSLDSTMAKSGKRSISYEGFAEEDCGIWYTDRMPIPSDGEFFFRLDFSQKHYMSQGFTAIVRFYDEDGKLISEEESEVVNWLTQVRRNGYFAAMVSNCIMYLMEGDEKYLYRVKDILDYTLWEIKFQIGRQDMSTEAVHVGRGLPAFGFAHELLTYAGLLTKEEDKRMRSHMYWIMEKMMDTSFYNYKTSHNRRHNFNADRCSGLGAIALALPEYSRSEEILSHAMEEWDFIIDESITDEGAWHESIRYHNAVYKVFFPFAVMLNNVKGINLFENEKIVAFGSYFARIQGPRDKVNLIYPNRAVMPNVSDSALFECNEPLARSAYMIRETNPKLSREMMYAWHRMGDLYPEANPSVYLYMDPNLPAQRPNYVSTAFDGIGYAVFRQNYDMDNEDYMHIMAAGNNYGSHQHQDRGSFAIWKNGVPLVIEAGVGDYDAAGKVIRSADWHNVLQFVSGNNRDGGKVKDETLSFDAEKDFFASNDLDMSRSHLSRGTGDGKYDRHVRNYAFVKNNFGVYLIWDDLNYTQASEKARFTYHTLTTGSKVSGNTVTSPGYEGMSLDATFLQDENIEPELEWQLMGEGYPQRNGQNQFQSISVEHPSNQDFLVVLYPRRNEEASLQMEKLAVENRNAAAYRISKQGSGYFCTLKNSADSAQSITLPADEPMTDMRNGAVYEPKNGKIQLTVAEKEIIILLPDSVEKPYPSQITLEGAKSVGIPSTGETSYVFQSITKDQYGNSMERANEAAQWRISGDTDGVRIDEDGVLYVSSTARKNGVVTLTVQAEGTQTTAEVQLTERATVNTADIMGPLIVPKSETGLSSVQYSAVFYDEYGTVIEDVSAAWYLNQPIAGVSLDSRTGRLFVGQQVTKGTKIELTAECIERPTVMKTIVITVGDRGISSLELEGSSIVGIPSETVFTAIGKDQYGTQILSERIIFSLKQETPGISITPEGVLRVLESAEENTSVTIRAASASNPSVSAEYQVSVRRRAAAAVRVDGQSRIETPASGYQSYTYTARIQDQNGDELDEVVEWSLLTDVRGIEINSSTGTLIVPSGASSQTVTIKAAVKENPRISGTKMVAIAGREAEGGSGGGGGGGGGISAVDPLPVPTDNNNPAASNGGFTDLTSVGWAQEAILALNKNGIVNGMGDGLFAPNLVVTREQFAAMLVKGFGIQAETADTPFTDVMQGAWYGPYVAAAWQNGIVKGISEDLFGIGQEITREQMAAMACRAAEAAGIALQQEMESPVFTDYEEISKYAREAVKRMQAAGLINGMDDGRFEPRGKSTRAQAAVVLYRLLNQQRGVND